MSNVIYLDPIDIQMHAASKDVERHCRANEIEKALDALTKMRDLWRLKNKMRNTK